MSGLTPEERRDLRHDYENILPKHSTGISVATLMALLDALDAAEQRAEAATGLASGLREQLDAAEQRAEKWEDRAINSERRRREMEQRAEKAEAELVNERKWIENAAEVSRGLIADRDKLRGIANEQIDSLLAKDAEIERLRAQLNHQFNSWQADKMEAEAHAERLATRMLLVADELGEIQRDAGSERLREQLSGIEGALRIDLRAYEVGKA